MIWFIVSRDYSHYSAESGDDMDNTRIEADIAIILDFIAGGRMPKGKFRLIPKNETQKTLLGFRASRAVNLSVEGEVSLDGKTTNPPVG